MFNISNPFSSDKYTPFLWDEDEFSKRALGVKNYYIAKNNYIFLPRYHETNKDIHIITETGIVLDKTITLVPSEINKLLNREDHNLELFTINDICDKSTSVQEGPINYKNIQTYPLEILREQRTIIKNWLDVFIEYSSKRRIGKSNLYSIPSIKIKIADIMLSLMMLEKMLHEIHDNENKTILNSISKEVIHNLDNLIKLIGGRTMLKGNLVEMKFVFNLYNFVWLGENK